MTSISRRDLLKSTLTTAAGAAAGMFLSPQSAKADESSLGGKLNFVEVADEVNPCRVENGAVVRPARTIPTISETDVLVVGAGPAGCTAAIAAARAGVKVTLVERYNHFGGLATGGLVLVILGHWARQSKGEQPFSCCQGIGEEYMQRLEAMPLGIVNRRHGVNPTIDAEAYKYLLQEMLTEANVEILLHSWATDAIMSGNVCRGAIFECKSGPQAILAKQVIDTTGDGDIFAAAGAKHQVRKFAAGLVHTLGGLNQIDNSKRQGQPPLRGLGSVTPVPGLNWVNMSGPQSNGVDVKELTRLELAHRKHIWQNYLNLKKQPGTDKVFLAQTAPQMGVRITRVIDGVETITWQGMESNQEFDDFLAYSGSWNANHQRWQIPFGAMLPQNVENIITAGRSLSGEHRMSDDIRVIPTCWVSGHAAGCAAAVAVKTNVDYIRNVDIPAVRDLLRTQKAYLG
ncbi:MAG: FAD-dependent oxidoreductase [Thermoguttaceae bacterium]|nr:FAD-dependent oxidoreductase [Thermoguttaceae bacterium]